LPAKMGFEESLYVRLHRTLYPNFGRIGGIAEILAVITTGGLAYWLRRRRPKAFPLTGSAAGCLAAAHGAFWVLVSPANSTMASWPLDSIPSDWTRWRDQWEYTHAVRAFLVMGALGMLVFSVLRETSDRPELFDR
jgi:Domain of unknown function (DUF1772)